MQDKELVEQLNDFLKDYDPPFVSNDWPMENGVYKQYSAFDTSNTTVGATSFCH